MPLVFDSFLRIFRALGKTPQVLLTDRIGLYLQQQGRDVTLAKGYCHGLALYWAYMKKNGKEQQYFDLINKLALWNGIDDLDTEFEKLLAHIEWLQRKHELIFGRQQLDIDSTLEAVKETETSRMLKDSYKFSFVFKENEIADCLERVCKEGEIILLSSHLHVIAMVFEDGKYHFFDANSFNGVITYNSIEEFVYDKKGLLQSLIFPELHTQWQQMKSEIQKTIFGLPVPENFPLHIEILRAENDPVQEYPSQLQLMQSILADRSQKKLSTSLNETGFSQSTSLILAATEDDFESLKALIELGADVNMKDKFGQSALHHSVLNNNLEMTKYLLSHGADLSATDADSHNLLHYFIQNGQDVELKAYLIGQGVDILAMDKDKEKPLILIQTNYSQQDAIFLSATALKQAILAGDMRKLDLLYAQSKSDLRGPSIRKLFEFDFPERANKSWYVYLLENNHAELLELFFNNDTAITYHDLLEIKKFSFASKDKLVNAIETKLFHQAITKNDQAMVSQLLSENSELIQFSYKDNTPIMTALNAKQSEMVKFLISKGAEYHELGSQKLNPIAYALEKEDLSSIKIFLEQGIDIDDLEDVFIKTNQSSHVSQAALTDFVNLFIDKPKKKNIEILLLRSALVTAAKRGFIEVLDRILTAEPQLVKQVEEDENTLLHVAAQQNNVDVMKFLLEKQHDFDLNTLNDDKKIPLHVAAEYGNDDMVRFLLTKNRDPSLLDESGFSPLHYAVQANSLACMKTLVENNADVNSGQKKDDITPLYIALSHKRLDMVKFLISHNADPNKIGLNQNALDRAVGTKDLSLIKYCIEDLKLDVKGVTSNTLLNLVNNRELTILKYLVGKGVEIPEYDHQDRLIVDTYFPMSEDYKILLQHSAVRRGDLVWLAQSLEKQPNVNITSYDNKTLLHVAVETGRIDMIEYLLQQGAYVNARADRQQTPLHIAAKLGRSDIVESLLKYGANVNAQMSDGNTPLHLAAANNNDDVTAMLLRKGATFNSVNKKDEKPFAMSKHDEHPQKENTLLLNEITQLFEHCDFKSHAEVFHVLVKLHHLPASSSPPEYQNNLRTVLNEFKPSGGRFAFFYDNSKQVSAIIENAKQKIEDFAQAPQTLSTSKGPPTVSS